MNKSLYQNCRELPIHNFNEIIITGDLSFLVKDGSQQDEKELADHWQNIISEFHEISNDKLYNRILMEKAEIIYLQGKVLACQIVFGLLGRKLSHEVAEKVDELRQRYKIRNVKSSLAQSRNKLKLKIAQFERMTTHEESKASLGSMIANLSRVLGYKIDRFTTTVEEWIELVKTAEEIIKEKKKLKEKGKG